METVETLKVALPPDMAAEIRAAVEEGIGSGPSQDADTVFAGLRARFSHSPAARVE